MSFGFTPDAVYRDGLLVLSMNGSKLSWRRWPRQCFSKSPHDSFLLAEDAFHPQLKTHKLKGKLAGSWACSAGHGLRVVFQLVKHKGEEAVLLESIGTHDEVY
jgi:hypothetical protein